MLALVAARGGSKRLPGKNIRLMDGKPLIQYTLETALRAEKISRIIVSTDCPDIRAAALEIEGVEAPFLRPAEYAGDDTQAYEVHMHLLDWLAEHEGAAPEDLCLLLATSPLRLPEDIDGSIDLYKKRDADVVMSVYQTKPLAWHLNVDAETQKMTSLLDIDGRAAVANYQDHDVPPYILNGSVYVLKVPVYRETKTYFGPKTYGYEMPLARSMDIDTLDDFDLAQSILLARQNRSKAA